jgi:hypothetical protein
VRNYGWGINPAMAKKIFSKTTFMVRPASPELQRGEQTHHERVLKWVLITVLMILSCSVFAQDLIFNNPVTVSGLLKTKMFYGPPGYGEDPKSDARETAYILYLNHPIQIPMENSGGGAVYSKMQVVYDNPKLLRKLVGRKVTVSGDLFESMTGHHHTEILIQASGISRQTIK